MQTEEKKFTLSEIKEMLHRVLIYENDVLEADDPYCPSWVNWEVLDKVLDRWTKGEKKYWKP